jgi:hypothetical protein
MFIRKHASKLALVLAVVVASFASIGSVAAAGSGATLRGVAPQLDASVAAASAGDWATARTTYKAFDDAWDSVRDDVLVSAPSAYSAIEDSAEAVETAVGSAGTPADSAAAVTALKAHRDLIAQQAAALS